MSFPSTLTNFRLHIDGTQRGLWTTRFVDPDTFIETMPSLDSGVITLDQQTEANQAELVSDAIYFPVGGGKGYPFPNTNMVMGGADAQFSWGFHLSNLSDESSNMIILTNDGGGRDFEFGVLSGNIVIRVRGNVIFNESYTAGEQFISFRIDTNTQLADVIYNGTEFNDISITGTDTERTNNFIGGRNVSNIVLQDSSIDKIVAAESFISLSELRDLDSFLRGELTTLGTTITDIETGNPKQNVVVKFFEMDAFAADGMDETTAFQNVSFLPGVFVTDTNGEVEFSGSIDDTKVQGAIALDNEYDAQWKFTGWVNLGTDNIDKTAPT